MAEKSIDTITAKIAGNINVRNRPDDLIEVGNNIEWLIKKIGDKKTVAKKLGISTDMLNKFLAVFKVTDTVKSMIATRKIDSVFSVHALKSLLPNDQLFVAKEIAAKRFNSQEARALIPLRNTFPNEKIERLVNVIRTTKDSKNYVNHFPYPGEEGVKKIKSRIKNVIMDEKFSLESDGNIGIFKITKKGNKLMREDASKMGKGFHEYLLTIFNPSAKM